MRQTALIRKKRVLNLFRSFMALLPLLISACSMQSVTIDESYANKETKLQLNKVTYKSLSGWVADNHTAALKAFLKSCKKPIVLPSSIKSTKLKTSLEIKNWKKACKVGKKVKLPSKIEAQYFFETNFTPYLVSNNSSSIGLFTGYYEPELRGSWQPNSEFRFPIYRKPNDLVYVDLGKFKNELSGTHLIGRREQNKILPYYTRAQINKGALKGKQLELLWVDSAIQSFFLHIQGSGRIVLKDGSIVRIGFAGRNGHRYTPIGRELVAMKVLEPGKVSLQSIQAWLINNPLAGLKLMEKNKAYIFFHILDGMGPVGSQGVVLTPGRSIAIDRKFLPLGLPVWLETTEPTKAKKPLRRLVVAQDTGSAIKGPVRGDLFFGHGNKAGLFAGRMQQKGKYYLLIPK
ncbi:MAG: MltA domain-containing protein [Pseudomonadota bacterium]|nr:MltA domain-containing protein [Pseudomonadota bacterium]